LIELKFDDAQLEPILAEFNLIWGGKFVLVCSPGGMDMEKAEARTL
jgi:hypothetical protein